MQIKVKNFKINQFKKKHDYAKFLESTKKTMGRLILSLDINTITRY